MRSTDRNPKSVRTAEARERVTARLVAEGFEWVQERAEFQHPDGRRGRLVFTPDYDAPLEDHKADWIRAVKLQAPGRPPQGDELFGTVGAQTPVIEFW